MTIDEAAVGKGVAVLFGPSAKDVVVLLVGKLSQVTEKERGGRRGLEQTKRRAETSDDEEEERPETVKRDGRREDEKRGKGEREWHRRHLCFLSFHLTHLGHTTGPLTPSCDGILTRPPQTVSP